MNGDRITRRTTILVACLLMGSCVSKGTHEATLSDLSRARAQQEEIREEMLARLERCEARLAEAATAREASETRLHEQIARTLDELRRSEDRRSLAQSDLEEARREIARLETLLDRRGGEYRRLEERLQSLAAIEREVRERNAIYEEVIGRFRSLIDAGRLSVSIDRGRMVINLPQDILFESGSAALGAEGRRTLGEVASVLGELDDRRFQIEGHTDNVPIATSRFPSNWELSAARALSVVRLLADQGVSPDNLSGAGYGEYQPVAENTTPESRRRNRRIEIVMLPNLDVIASLEVPGAS